MQRLMQQQKQQQLDIQISTHYLLNTGAPILVEGMDRSLATPKNENFNSTGSVSLTLLLQPTKLGCSRNEFAQIVFNA